MTKAIKRYLLTSAQNNTELDVAAWDNMLALAAYYKAKVMVGTYTYNKSGIGAKGAKRKTSKEQDQDKKEWWDERLKPYMADMRVSLSSGLEWCGEMQILPTATNPLSGLEGYTGRHSSIFPHAKIAMSSVPSGQFEPTKLMYTTGSVTKVNYIQKKAGLKAQFHHSIGCLLVEVDSKNTWFVRQVSATDDGELRDLSLRVLDGKVSCDTSNVEAIVWGDIHVAQIDPIMEGIGWCNTNSIVDTLRPKYQFMHDLFDGQAIQKHNKNKHHHEVFRVWTSRGNNLSVAGELRQTETWLHEVAFRIWSKIVIVNSNHDQMLRYWLETTSHKDDPENAIIHLRADLFMHEWLKEHPNDSEPPLLFWALTSGYMEGSLHKFLAEDESFILCPDANGGIECGMHGHRGPGGARGSIRNLARMGRKSVVGHSHTAGIFEGCYQVGLSGLLNQSYNRGPSSWSQTLCVIYTNGKRALITVYNGKWRA